MICFLVYDPLLWIDYPKRCFIFKTALTLVFYHQPQLALIFLLKYDLEVPKIHNRKNPALREFLFHKSILSDF